MSSKCYVVTTNEYYPIKVFSKKEWAEEFAHEYFLERYEYWFKYEKQSSYNCSRLKYEFVYAVEELGFSPTATIQQVWYHIYTLPHDEAFKLVSMLFEPNFIIKEVDYD